MADGGFQDQPQRHDFIVQGAACGRLAGAGRGRPVHPVLLHFPRRHLGESQVPEEGTKMKADADFVALGPALAPLALGDNPVFFLELVGGSAERLFCLKEACAGPAAQSQIPVLGELLGGFEVLFACRTAKLLARLRPSTASIGPFRADKPESDPLTARGSPLFAS